MTINCNSGELLPLKPKMYYIEVFYTLGRRISYRYQKEWWDHLEPLGKGIWRMQFIHKHFLLIWKHVQTTCLQKVVVFVPF